MAWRNIPTISWFLPIQCVIHIFMHFILLCIWYNHMYVWIFIFWNDSLIFYNRKTLPRECHVFYFNISLQMFKDIGRDLSNHKCQGWIWKGSNPWNLNEIFQKRIQNLSSKISDAEDDSGGFDPLFKYVIVILAKVLSAIVFKSFFYWFLKPFRPFRFHSGQKVLSLFDIV